MLFHESSLPVSYRPVVYVVQETSYNLVPASQYGRIEVMVHNKCTSDREYEKAFSEIKKWLQCYNDDCFILPIGDPILIGIAFSEAAKIANGKKINVLQWDRDAHQYIPFKIPTT